MAIQARKSDWKTDELPRDFATLDWSESFSEGEFAQLCVGLIPEQMEDKWFIYFEEPNLYFHRSWSGSCIYIVKIEQRHNGYAISEVRANRDPEQYTGSAETDVAILQFLIRNLLLGEDVPFPLPPDSTSSPSGLYQHHVGGIEHPNTGERKRKWWRFWQ